MEIAPVNCFREEFLLLLVSKEGKKEKFLQEITGVLIIFTGGMSKIRKVCSPQLSLDFPRSAELFFSVFLGYCLRITRHC